MRNTGLMGRIYDEISDQVAQWLEAQPVFFVATAPLSEDGRINCSPKGNRDEFKVVDAHTVAYLDQTGSGIETLAHVQENGRIVLMFCAFEGRPRIVRLHGIGRSAPVGTDDFAALASRFPRASDVGVRSIVAVEVRRIADSCGYGVPLMKFEGHRPTMDEWATRKGPDGIRAYWADNNLSSIDALEGLSRPR
jgi:hypothetical protein